MANEQERLTASDLNSCLVAREKEEVGEQALSYLQPLFTGFCSVLGDRDLLLRKDEEARKTAQEKYNWARLWQEIISSFENKTPYTEQQIALIDEQIEKKNLEKKFYESLQEQDEALDELDFFALKQDIESAILGQDRFQSFAAENEIAVKSSYKITDSRLIIVHAAVDTTLGQTVENSKSQILAQLQVNGLDLRGLEITHLIPEIGHGRMDGLFGVNHIRLRVVQGNQDELIDPRDIHQGTFDTVHCGRYVTTMIGQAVGLHGLNSPISVAALKASPIVENAAKFTTPEALQEATKFASEHPIDVRAQAERVRQIVERLEQLSHSYQQRDTLGLHYNHFWGSFFGGYSAAEKRTASQAVIQNYKQGRSNLLDGVDEGVAEQGELGKLVRELEEAKDSDNKQNNSQSLNF